SSCGRAFATVTFRLSSATCALTSIAEPTPPPRLRRAREASSAAPSPSPPARSSVPADRSGTIPRPFAFRESMRSGAFRSAALSLAGALPVVAQQVVDTHSIPAKSKYARESYAGKKPLTRAERTGFTETSHYDDVVAFIDSLKTLGAKISTGS